MHQVAAEDKHYLGALPNYPDILELLLAGVQQTPAG
jgi:hypothetical protein